MKTKNFIFCCAACILLGTAVGNLQAQWQTSGSNIYYNNGNVGIGTSNPIGRLHVNGELFLNNTKQINGVGYSFLHWEAHNLVMGTLPEFYAHNILAIRPGGATQGPLYSMFELYNAPTLGQYDLKVSICSDGNTFFNGGNVGIGTDAPAYKLDVRGTIRANEIVVNTGGADFVFADDYRLRPLPEVERFIVENKHLPDIAPADSMVQNGVNMGEMQIQLLQKIEELTLYVIEQGKLNEELKLQVQMQQKKIESLEETVDMKKGRDKQYFKR